MSVPSASRVRMSPTKSLSSAMGSITPTMRRLSAVRSRVLGGFSPRSHSSRSVTLGVMSTSGASVVLGTTGVLEGRDSIA